VYHPHFHVVPRTAGDGLITHPTPYDGMVKRDAAAAMLQKMQAADPSKE